MYMLIVYNSHHIRFQTDKKNRIVFQLMLMHFTLQSVFSCELENKFARKKKRSKHRVESKANEVHFRRMYLRWFTY